jgi:fucose 4-O-acetylase-like acetyltransferase
MKTKTQTETRSVDWILISKGIGIILVVVGHFYPPEVSPTYWIEMRKIIYSFHMPLFFLLSGYLYTHGKYAYLTLLNKKVKRLLYPFISIALLFFLIKYSAGIAFKLEHPVDGNSIITLLTDPVNSYMPLLWFVHALFIIFVIYPLLRYLTDNAIIIIAASFIASSFFSNILVIGSALHNLPFFVIGALIKERNYLNSYIVSSSPSKLLIAVTVFVLSYVFHCYTNTSGVTRSLIFVTLGLAGSLVIVYFSQLDVFFRRASLKKIISSIGYYSMTIYLFHTLFESAVRIGFLKVLTGITFPFELVAITAIICGVIFPLLLEKFILRKSTFGRKYILGIS